ncbi:hypothetical protein [Phenylobacterium sp.]|jgi:hypothetical protein|uniref:hypothetical protein n=1 Tax=Phenylobacterium sp. TaxID=1871053 RepID=UPI002F9482A1
MAHSDRIHWNRDDEQKPGDPPRTAYEPKGSEGSSRNAKTMTDPVTGEPQKGAPEPNQADAGETENLD